jgi:hypothetical protein
VAHLEALQAVPHFSHTLIADSGRDAASFDEHGLPGTSPDELPLIANTTGSISVGARAVALALSRRGHRTAPLCIHPVLFRPETTRGYRTGAIRITVAVFIFLVAIGASVAKLEDISMSVFCGRGKPRGSDVRKRENPQARSMGVKEQEGDSACCLSRL